MPKKKKALSRFFSYRTLLLSLIGAVLLVALYCLYASKSPPVFVLEKSPSPVRIPGPSTSKPSYEIYHRLIDTSKKPMTEQLLPPQEVPDIVPPPAPAAAQPAPPPAQPPALPPSKELPPAAPSLKAAPLPAQTIPPLQGRRAPQPAKPASPAKPQSKIPALQVGSFYPSLLQAQQGLSSLQRFAPWPAGVIPRIQQTQKKGQKIYRLVLTRFPNLNALSVYKSLLLRKKIVHVLLP